jgi:hypothetical protein
MLQIRGPFGALDRIQVLIAVQIHSPMSKPGSVRGREARQLRYIAPQHKPTSTTASRNLRTSILRHGSRMTLVTLANFLMGRVR